MANNQPFSSVPVIPSDTLNIPQPGIITSGTNATVGTTLTDAGQDFTNATTNSASPSGYNIRGGDVVYAGGAINEILAIASPTTLTMQSSTAGDDVILNNIPDSSFIPLQAIRVFATDTTCSNILALN